MTTVICTYTTEIQTGTQGSVTRVLPELRVYQLGDNSQLPPPSPTPSTVMTTVICTYTTEIQTGTQGSVTRVLPELRVYQLGDNSQLTDPPLYSDVRNQHQTAPPYRLLGLRQVGAQPTSLRNSTAKFFTRNDRKVRETGVRLDKGIKPLSLLKLCYQTPTTLTAWNDTCTREELSFHSLRSTQGQVIVGTNEL